MDVDCKGIVFGVIVIEVVFVKVFFVLMFGIFFVVEVKIVNVEYYGWFGVYLVVDKVKVVDRFVYLNVIVGGFVVVLFRRRMLVGDIV